MENLNYNNIIEYITRKVFKKQPLERAITVFVKKFSGGRNPFLGDGVLELDKKEILEKYYKDKCETFKKNKIDIHNEGMVNWFLEHFGLDKKKFYEYYNSLINLKEAIHIILHEWNVQNKKELGKGRDKKAFELKTNSDYIIKKFDNDLGVENEIKFQKLHPDLYAKIVKVNYERGYLIQEKLNTKEFLNEVERVITLLRKLGFYFGLGFDSLKFYFIGDDEVEVKEFHKAVEKLNDPFLNKLKLFFYKLMSDYGYPHKFLDIHDGNLGLDKNGNIKLLDL